MLEDHDRQRRIVAAVCAATTALAIHKIGLGRNVTSYPAPAFKEKLESAGYKHMDDEVVADKNILTRPVRDQEPHSILLYRYCQDSC